MSLFLFIISPLAPLFSVQQVSSEKWLEALCKTRLASLKGKQKCREWMKAGF